MKIYFSRIIVSLRSNLYCWYYVRLVYLTIKNFYWTINRSSEDNYPISSPLFSYLINWCKINQFFLSKLISSWRENDKCKKEITRLEMWRMIVKNYFTRQESRYHRFSLFYTYTSFCKIINAQDSSNVCNRSKDTCQHTFTDHVIDD